jgi:hypothetical protein
MICDLPWKAKKEGGLPVFEIISLTQLFANMLDRIEKIDTIMEESQAMGE